MEDGIEGAGRGSQAPVADEVESMAQETSDPEGTRAKSFRIVHPRKTPKKILTPTPATPFSPLPVVSVVLGLMSLLLPWVVTQTMDDPEFARLTEYMTSPQDFNAVYSVAAVLVFIGSVFTFVWRPGALVSLAGVILFVLDRPSGSSDASIGLIVAGVAAVIGCVSIFWSPTLKLPSRFISVTAHPLGGYRVSTFSYIAFSVGVASLVLAWLVHTQSLYGREIEHFYTFAYLFERPDYVGGLECYVAEALIVAGTALCLLTSLGGAVMLSGLVLFFLEAREVLGTFDDLVFGSTTVLGYGFYICLVASIIAIASMIKTYDARICLPSARARSDAPSAEPSSPGPSRGLHDGTGRSLSSIMVNALKPAAVLVVTLIMLIAIVAVSFALPFSTLVVNVGNWDGSSILEVGVYVDGELADDGLASPGANFVVECSTSAGPHHVELDYAFLSFVPDGVDGVPDWRGSVNVDPFQRYWLYFPSQIEDLALPVVTFGAAETANGERISVEGSVNYAYGVQYEMDISWSASRLVLTDGSSFAHWDPEQVDLDGGTPTQSDLGAVLLGEVNVTCAVTDLAGDGDLSQGDYFDLTVSTGSFSEGVTYTFYLLYYGDVVGKVSFVG